MWLNLADRESSISLPDPQTTAGPTRKELNRQTRNQKDPSSHQEDWCRGMRKNYTYSRQFQSSMKASDSYCVTNTASAWN
ncbi:hypothetical protein E2C01_047373 [Portunus trituberculatus]|uniref:Uncharacterized protein n=1 Tax=Portunus trituberculatus TaxID=210409 RepID=A0A5B7G798_PORTR|nr:hypothetical protein [Portunus trituberculatus]